MNCLDCAENVSMEVDEKVLVVEQNGADQIIFEKDFVGVKDEIVASFYGGELVD